MPHPAGCFTEPVPLSRPLEDHPFTRTYIKATADGNDAFWAAAQPGAAVARLELPRGGDEPHGAGQPAGASSAAILLELS